MKKRLSHLDAKNRPQMVNVGSKPPTHRIARAQAIVSLPPAIRNLFQGKEIRSPKGPVFQTAILAGVQAVKRTSELIPLCHPIPVEHIGISIRMNARGEAAVECRVEAHHKTGVEMEAFTGAAVAALTIYDMCKGLSRDIVIRDIRLLEKKGGKSDYTA